MGGSSGPSTDRAVDISRLDIRVGKIISADKVKVGYLCDCSYCFAFFSPFSPLAC